MNAETIAELRQLEAAAIPAPWAADYDRREGGAHQVCAPNAGRRGLTICFISHNIDGDDYGHTAFIAAMRNVLPDLLDAAERVMKTEATQKKTGSILECLAKARAAGRGAWDQFDDPDAVIRWMRGYDVTLSEHDRAALEAAK